MRINRYLASAGIASRRKSEEYIVSGRVMVNGKVVNSLAFDVADNDEVKVDGEIVSLNDFYYIMLHKPKGYITTMKDEKGRKTVMDLIPEEYAGVKPIGRLDYETEGLLILSNDGDLAQKLTSPINEIEKTYSVKVEGKLQESQLAVMRAGVVIDGVRLKKCKVKKISEDDKFTKLEVKITEGKNRQIRKMFDAVGVNVVFLKRTAIQDLKLGSLDRGKVRELRPSEIMYLQQLI